MGLRIATNLPSVTARRNLNQSGEAQASAMERLSSGFRINKAMDDVAGLAISESMRGQVRSMAQAERNAQDGISFVQVAEGGLTESSNILIRLRELATQASSDTLGNEERKFVDIEVQQLKKELDRIAETTEFSGTKLLNGSAETLEFHIGIKGDENNRIELNASFANATSDNLNISGLSVLEKGDARDSLQNLETALQTVSEMRANFGATQSRMNSTINNLRVYRENLSAAQSRIKDADMADEASDFAKAKILQQAGIATLAQANASSSMALKLL